MADAPKIQIDSDWKAQAQAEKQRLAEQAKQKESSAAAAPGAGPSAGSPRSAGRQLPPANFEGLVATLASQAQYAMGGVTDPQTGQRMVILDLARHSIDLLGVLEEKCRGNLTQEEEQMLASTLYALRDRYVRIVAASRQT